MAHKQECNLQLFINFFIVLGHLTFLSLHLLSKQLSIKHFLDTNVGPRESKAQLLPSRNLQSGGN